MEELIPSGGGLELGEEEDFAVMGPLLSYLLVRRSRLYTMAESTSLREETMRELFAALCFLLSHYRTQTGQALSALTQKTADAAVDEAIGLLRRKAAETQRLYETVCLHLPPVENVLLTDTLKSIGGGFHRYDVHYFAHIFPCSIDYFLCLSVSEEVRGVCFVEEYLRRMLVEELFLRCFGPRETDRLLTLASGEYRYVPLNLCAPVLTNAMGLSLLGEDPRTLRFTPDLRERLRSRLGGLSAAETAQALTGAVGDLTERLGLTQPQAADYLARCGAEQAPYVAQALVTGGLEQVFPGW